MPPPEPFVKSKELPYIDFFKDFTDEDWKNLHNSFMKEKSARENLTRRSNDSLAHVLGE